MLFMSVCTARHRQTSGRPEQVLNVCTHCLLTIHKLGASFALRISTGSPSGLAWSLYTCAVLWRVAYVATATERPLGTICEFKGFVKGRNFFSRFTRFLSRRDMTLAVESDVKSPLTLLPLRFRHLGQMLISQSSFFLFLFPETKKNRNISLRNLHVYLLETLR